MDRTAAFVLLALCVSSSGEEPPQPSCTVAGSGSIPACTSAVSDGEGDAMSLLQHGARSQRGAWLADSPGTRRNQIRGDATWKARGAPGSSEEEKIQDREHVVSVALGNAQPVTLNGANASVPSVLSREKKEELDSWLQKLHAHLEERGVSALGANGSAGPDREQMRTVLDSLAQEPWIKTVCETGFNQGDTALRFLVLSDAQVYDFDLGTLNYTRPATEFLQKNFPGRLHLTWGDSTDTLPAFHKSRPGVSCDLAIVDGGHDYKVARADIRNFYPMVPEQHVLFVDDTPCDAGWCVGVNKAWEEMRDVGCIEQTMEHRHDDWYGFRAGLYNSCQLLDA